jgi:hypothetical protein
MPLNRRCSPQNVNAPRRLASPGMATVKARGRERPVEMLACGVEFAAVKERLTERGVREGQERGVTRDPGAGEELGRELARRAELGPHEMHIPEPPERPHHLGRLSQHACELERPGICQGQLGGGIAASHDHGRASPRRRSISSAARGSPRRIAAAHGRRRGRDRGNRQTGPMRARRLIGIAGNWHRLLPAQQRHAGEVGREAARFRPRQGRPRRSLGGGGSSRASQMRVDGVFTEEPGGTLPLSSRPATDR